MMPEEEIPRKTLQERLNQVSRNIKGIKTSESTSGTVLYETDGDRVSVMIKTTNSGSKGD